MSGDSSTLGAPGPEHWRVEVAGDSVAVLNLPGLLARSQVFDLDVSLMVDVPLDALGAWHGLSVELDGQRQWGRRVSSHNPGQTDGLDYHQRVRLEAGASLRVRATADIQGVRVRQLLIEAREISG